MKLNIVWLGELGFPIGMASSQRAALILNGIRLYGVNAIVINRYGIYNQEESRDIKTEGEYQNVRYLHASGISYRPENFFARNIYKVWGTINEIHVIYKLRKKGLLDAAFLHAENFRSIVGYKLLSTLLGFPLIMNYVELTSSYSTKKGMGHKIGSYLYEKFGYSLVDGIMPISDYLADIVKSRNSRVPVMKVPIITDFDRFNGVERNIEEKYFLFCGSAFYLEVIIFILKAFERLESSKEVRLYLVGNGSIGAMSRLKEEVAKNGKSSLIKMYSGISDNQLTELYANASGLLIPLRPTVQDTARFPHKIGEYVASGNPVVTTNYGEVAKYFEDEKSALIAGSYDIAEFSKKMRYIILNPEKAKEIGRRGREVGLANFDYKLYGLRIREFINSIIIQRPN